jgi:chromosomal replication initiation ATPase DnaA
MAAQLWFDFSLPGDSFDRSRFCEGSSNADAVHRMARWKDWPMGCLLLVGPKGSGKSHLARMWIEENGGIIVHSSSIPKRLQGNVAVDHLPGDMDEEGLFHLINRAMNGATRVLIMARELPRGWKVELGDLRSRLHSIELAQIDEPDDEVLACILKKLCQDRLIKPDDKLIKYLVERMDRSSEYALNLVERLNAKSLETSRPVNMKLAREVMQEETETPQLLALMEGEPLVNLEEEPS